VRQSRGDFRGADPSRGRFRDYVKTSVIHLLGEFRRRDQRRNQTLPLSDGAAKTEAQTELDDTEFVLAWRKELLNRAWHEMELRQPPDGAPYYAALRIKAEEPTLSAGNLAGRLKKMGHGSHNAAGVRQLLHRARQTYSSLLTEEVKRSLASDDPDELASELADLGLLTYCRMRPPRVRE
jgi:hypothetical protein